MKDTVTVTLPRKQAEAILAFASRGMDDAADDVIVDPTAALVEWEAQDEAVAGFWTMYAAVEEARR